MKRVFLSSILGGILFVHIFLPSFVFAEGETVILSDEGQSGSSSPSCDTDTSYCLLAPLPIGGDKSLVNKFYFTSTDTALPADEKATNFGSYINGLFTFAIGMAGALAVVLIVIGGIQYMSTDNFAEKAEGRGRIISALSGLILLIGAYMILNTINPNLVNFKFKISEVSVEASAIISIPAETFESITGQTLLSSNEYYNMAASSALAKGLDPCIAKAVVRKESGGSPLGIGHNENVTLVSDRKNFLSGLGVTTAGKAQKYSGILFDAISTTDTAALTNSKEKNDDTGDANGNPPNPTAPNLGLDWRYSHDIGLMQINVPKGAFLFVDKDADVHSPGGHTPRELFDPQTNIDEAIDYHLVLNSGIGSCSSSVTDETGLKLLFTSYNSGSSACSTGIITEYGQSTYALFQSCRNGEW